MAEHLLPDVSEARGQRLVDLERDHLRLVPRPGCGRCGGEREREAHCREAGKAADVEHAARAHCARQQLQHQQFVWRCEFVAEFWACTRPRKLSSETLN